MGTIDLPLLTYNSPGYLEGIEFTGELVARLIERLPNFIGMKEASFNSEKFLEISRVALALRPDFALITGVEFLLPSIPLGGVGSFSAAGAISPNLCNELYDACVAEDWPRARAAQYKITRLWMLFRDQYPSSLKGRHGDDGPSGRADAAAAADRHQGATGLTSAAQLEALKILRDRAARLVNFPTTIGDHHGHFQPGLVHTPVTPFTRRHRIDFDRYRKLIEFHIRQRRGGAGAADACRRIGQPHRRGAAQAPDRVRARARRRPRAGHRPCQRRRHRHRGRALARHAEGAAAAIVATTPYYWTPPPVMIVEHFAQIGAAVRIPFLVHNAPEEMGGHQGHSRLALKLIERLRNFAGLVDASLDWQFMIDLLTDARATPDPDFALIAGTELMVSAAAIGASGLFAPLAGIAPRRLRALFELCRGDHLFEARGGREQGCRGRPIGEAGRRRQPQGSNACGGSRLRRAAPATAGA